jgi:hypothetical protein
MRSSGRTISRLRSIALWGLVGVLAASLAGCTSGGPSSSAPSPQASDDDLPRLAEARLEGVWDVQMKVRRNTFESKPHRRQSGWRFHSLCQTGACDVLFKGTVEIGRRAGKSARDHLRFPMSKRRGNYQGRYRSRIHPSCGSAPAHLEITVTEARIDDRGRWVATAWEGTYARRSAAACGGERLRTLIFGTPTWAPQG